jgi:hypothetical protein
MGSVFDFLKVLFQTIGSFVKKPEKPDVIGIGTEPDIREDNLPQPVEVKPEPPKAPPMPTMQLWYPHRKVMPEFEKLKMRTIGTYKYKHPQGALVHFTAGRTKATSKFTEEQIRKFFIENSCNDKKFTYFIIDIWGNVFQQFPLDKWGYHGGVSSWGPFKGDVSSAMVGIEVMCAGKLIKKGSIYEAWFGEKFSELEVRHSKKTDQIEEGYYHKFTTAQEEALEKLIKWLEYNGDGIFQFKYVAGHDEVAPKRKNDPGASLSISMKEFREKLEKGS